MSHTFADKLESIGAPPPKFWENDLEVGVEHALIRTEQNGFVDEWIDQLTGRQIDILCNNLSIENNESVRRRKEKLQFYHDELLQYLLVNQFSRNKSKVAIIDFAQGVLDASVIDACQINEEKFDTTALLFAIYHKEWSDLRLIFHLDKIHRKGFARMKLTNNVRGPVQPFAEFLQPDIIGKILKDFDKSKRDRKTSSLKCIVPYDGSYLVFIRREERPALILRDTGIVHGYRPEWIILDFDSSAKYLKISSFSVSVPLEISNRMASRYFGKECEYKNESQITFVKQIERFLSEVLAGESGELLLVEITVSHSPLEGTPKIMITDPNSKPIGNSIAHFEKVIGEILSEINHIESIKVGYSNKRITVKFEKIEGAQDEYVVRYSDQRLNAIERRRFEEYIRTNHGITILSTEKRFKQ